MDGTGGAQTVQAPNMMDIYDMVAVILDSDDGIRGESTVQKIAYLVKRVHPHLDMPEFEPRYFGPASPGVYEALASLVAFRFASECEFARGRGYLYRLTADGRRFAADARRRHPGAYGMIRGAASQCLELCCGSGSALSFAAKIHYTCARAGPMTEREIMRRGADMEWGLTENEMRNALNLLRTLGLDP